VKQHFMHNAGESFHVITPSDRSSFTAMKTSLFLSSYHLCHARVLHMHNFTWGLQNIQVKILLRETRREMSVDFSNRGCLQFQMLTHKLTNKIRY